MLLKFITSSEIPRVITHGSGSNWIRSILDITLIFKHRAKLWSSVLAAVKTPPWTNEDGVELEIGLNRALHY